MATHFSGETKRTTREEKKIHKNRNLLVRTLIFLSSQIGISERFRYFGSAFHFTWCHLHWRTHFFAFKCEEITIRWLPFLHEPAAHFTTLHWSDCIPMCRLNVYSLVSRGIVNIAAHIWLRLFKAMRKKHLLTMVIISVESTTIWYGYLINITFSSFHYGCQLSVKLI